MTIVYNLPIDPMKNNVNHSLEYIEQEQSYNNIGERWLGKDSTTDIVMLNIASFRLKENALISAVTNPWLLDHDDEFFFGLKKSTFDEVDQKKVSYYARYWNGYCIYLKPLLLYFDYQEIVMINTVIQLMLLICVCVLYVRELGFKHFISFFAGIVILNPCVISRSLQYSDIYYITLITTMIVLYYHDYFKENNMRYIILFLCDGILVSFFDFLTYPLVALGLPLLTYVLLESSDSLRTCICDIVKYSIAWCVGYAGMWVGKWIISTLITGENILQDAANAFAFRTNGAWNGLDMSYKNVLKLNYTNIYTDVFKFFIYILIVILLIGVIVKKIKFSIKLNNVLPILFITLYPFVWYLVVRNHSAIHSWMTFREFSISVYGVLAVFIEFFVIEKKDNKKYEIEKIGSD